MNPVKKYGRPLFITNLKITVLNKEPKSDSLLESMQVYTMIHDLFSRYDGEVLVTSKGFLLDNFLTEDYITSFKKSGEEVCKKSRYSFYIDESLNEKEKKPEFRFKNLEDNDTLTLILKKGKMRVKELL